MNERIVDLYEKAGEWALESDSAKSYKDRVLAKFAELIVRDCALTAGLMEHEDRKGIGAQILDNYGVKYEQ